MYLRSVLASLITLVTITSLRAAAPLGTAFTYQGQLKNAGSPADGLHDLRFRLYDAITVGAPVGSATCVDNVNVTNGLFTVTLDFGMQFTGQERFLEIDVRADSGRDCTNPAGFVVLNPRQQLTPTPNAVFASNADQLDGLSSSAFLQGLPLPLVVSGSVGSTAVIKGTNTASMVSTIGVFGEITSTAVSGSSYGGFFTNNDDTGHGIYGRAYGVSGVGVYGDANAATGTNYGVYGQSDSTSGRGVYGEADAATGTTYGGFFESDSTSGRGVYGRANAISGTNYGVHGECASSSGIGVYGENSGPSGVGMKGLGHWGVTGIATTASGYGGVFGGSGGFGGGQSLLVLGDSELLGSVAIGEVVGNLGVGTSTPAVKLHVEGGTDSAPASGGYLVTGSTISTNISIDNNEIMARDNGATSTLFINNNGGDVVFGGAIDIGYQRVTASALTPGTTALCPVGKLVIGGGCSCGTSSVLESYPNQFSSGWTCVCNFFGVEAFAICARVK